MGETHCSFSWTYCGALRAQFSFKSFVFGCTSHLFVVAGSIQQSRLAQLAASDGRIINLARSAQL